MSILESKKALNPKAKSFLTYITNFTNVLEEFGGVCFLKYNYKCFSKSVGVFKSVVARREKKENIQKLY